MSATAEEAGRAAELRRAIDEAAALLPEQAPLHAFVHHNTLHHWEHLPFDDAIAEACAVLGTEGYQSERAFRSHLESGRILPGDVSAVLAAEPGEEASRSIFPGGPSVRAFRSFRLRHLFEIPSGATLAWHRGEGAAGSRLRSDVRPERRRRILAEGSEAEQLTRLWRALAGVAPTRAGPAVGPRWRDRIHARWGTDTDDRVHPLLIRFAGAFLDQGIAYWAMPYRSEGLLSAFRRLYGARWGSPARWRKGLAERLRRQQREGWSALDTIAWALDEGEVRDRDRAVFVRDTLLSLRGWAGMVRHLELRPDRAPVSAPPARLDEFLAVRLVLDLFAARAVVRERMGPGVGLGRLFEPVPDPAPGRDDRLVYEAFALAQYADLPLARFLEPDVAKGWLEAVREFGDGERRRILHLAYERRHRVQVLDALHAGTRRAPEDPKACDFQAIFCIDDREESIRRHLEELHPAVETFGYAGFFGVAMAYQGVDDVRTRPLCPVVIEPAHLVREVAAEPGDEGRYRRERRRRARLRHWSWVGSKTLVRGGLMAPLLGPLSVVPLVAQTLFPRLTHALGAFFVGLGADRPATRLQVERQDAADVERAVRQGYTTEEMAEIVASALRTMGLDASRSPLVVVVGHGSSSLNNPHEAAHDCGATGGGRGGPNARAFAVMANHPDVRRILRDRGLAIPSRTWFVGAYHNTCDDSIRFFDADLVPATARPAFTIARGALRRACRAEAHERARRFETAPLGLSVRRAMADVESHAVDLAQPRPEYGHATNAICIVGRRALTRGLFLDRRAFLVSYDPESDPSGELLAPLLLSVGPVGAGINLEYYFSFVDPTGFGCGTKLPHNITGLLGVMDGHASDLRTGLPWQMVEIHEPVRLLTIVDSSRAVVERILSEHEGLHSLVSKAWIQLVVRDFETGALHVFQQGAFVPYRPEAGEASEVDSSASYYGPHRDHLPPVWLSRRGRAA